jgi:hypothetical protein
MRLFLRNGPPVHYGKIMDRWKCVRITVRHFTRIIVFLKNNSINYGSILLRLCKFKRYRQWNGGPRIIQSKLCIKVMSFLFIRNCGFELCASSLIIRYFGIIFIRTLSHIFGMNFLLILIKNSESLTEFCTRISNIDFTDKSQTY